MPARRILACVLALCALIPARGAAGVRPAPLSAAHVEWGRASATMDAPPAPAGDVTGRAGETARTRPLHADRAAAYPSYAWPLDRHLHDGLLIVNYVDLDATSGRLDYSGGTHTYDGHRGTDYVLYSFRLMDRGCAIRAAAPGTVAYMSAPSPYDRNCSVAPDEGNWVWVDNGDGTYSEYYHLRANSVTVQVGDPIQLGQTIGLVGSSGYSTAPHLHFETGDYFGGPYEWRDPYHGPSNPLPSLWNVQDDYEGDDPLWFADMGVFSQSQTGGSVFNTTYCDIAERISQPVVFGADEPVLGIWVQFQGRQGDPFRIEVLRPDGSTYAGYDDVLGYKAQFDWFWVYWYWSGNVAPSDYGLWKVRALSDGVLSREAQFQVGASTAFGPRFWPRAGRSYRINGAVQKDTLRRSPLGGPVTFSLFNAPSFVTLTEDSILTIGPVSNQAYRSLFFQALAVDGAARRDTAWFHVVDMSKPVGPTVGVGPEAPPARLELSLDGPSPFAGATALRLRVDAGGRATLDVYDLRGRRVRRLLDDVLAAGEERTQRWDGRDDAGTPVAGGIYFARLACGGERRIVRLVRLR